MELTGIRAPVAVGTLRVSYADIQKTGKIKGVQFTGKFTELHGNRLETAKNKYYRKYPFARVIPGELWGIELRTVKMTDNTLGFGKKITWERPVEEGVGI